MGNNHRANSNEPATPAISPGLKKLLSVLIALHLLAVFVGPWAMPPHGSQLARWTASWIDPYIQAANLNNGYRFFAPEPSPGHLVHYEVVTGDGREIDGVFPDRKTEWPRLLYHRYFMMSEFLNTVMSNPNAATLAEKYATSYATHLLRQYDAKSVKLSVRQHRLPSMDDVRGGMKLDDPSLYDEKLVIDLP
jgi:hypothetical protein